MPAETEDILAIRREIWMLLCQQVEVLDSATALTDAQLLDCYVRQARVQELRERIEAAGGTAASGNVITMNNPVSGQELYDPQIAA